MDSNIPDIKSSKSLDAWFFLYASFGLYAIFTIVFSKVSIIGATAAGQLLCMLLPAILYAKWKSGSVVEGLRLGPVACGISWRVGLLAVTFVGVADLLQQASQPIIERYFSSSIQMLENLTKLLKPDSASGLVGNLLVVGLLAPVCEEAMFRGAFQGTLERRGPVRAILASSVVFAVVHMNPLHFLPILLIGIALGFVTWRTQSLWPAVLWHVINNTAAILSLYFGGESASMPLWLSVTLTLGFFALAWEFLCHMKKAPPSAPGPLATASSILGPVVGQVAKVGGLMVLFAMLACAVCFGRANLRSDFLAPDYNRGDMVVYSRGPAFRSDRLTTGDVIVYSGTAGLLFTRILAIDGEKVTVIGPEDDAGERAKADILREDITGKIFWKFDPGAEVKGLMLKAKDNSNGPTNDPHKPTPIIQGESSQ